MTFYLLRSFRRRPWRHISLAWILMCALLLPLVVSVYRDSLIYGVRLQEFDFHKGQAIHISGAQPEDTAWFQDIDGLTAPYYEDGTIYMTYDSRESEKRYQDVHEQVALSNLLKSKATQSEQSLEVMFFDIDFSSLNDPYMKTTLGKMQLLNLALLFFSGLVVQAAYRNHIDSFTRELADILAMGATKGQTVGMFLLEFLLVFPLSSAGAIGISYAVMHLLYEKYLGNTAASAAIWRVFHMDPGSTALQIGFYLLVCLGAMLYALLKKPAKTRIAKPRKAASLPRLWMQRTKTPFVSCLAILIPLFAAFVILFNQYLGTYAKTVYSSQDARITVDSFTMRSLSQAELDSISAIPGVNRVEPTWDFSEPYMLSTPDQNTLMVSIHLAEELPAGSPELEKYQFVSDLPESMESEEIYYLYRILTPMDAAEVTLAQRITSESDEQSAVNVYITKELMQELAGGYNRWIVHTSASQASNVEEELRRSLPASVNIFNYQNYVDTTMQQQEGNLWLLSWIFCILMIVAMQIVWVRLSKYVRDCGPMLRIIRQVGASRKQLSRLIPAHFGAIPAALMPFLIAIPWAWLDASRNDRPFIVSAPVIGIYLALALLAIVTFWLPVKVTLKNILKQTQ